MRLVLFLTTLVACVLPSVYSHTYLVSPKPRNYRAYQNNPVQGGDVVKYGYINPFTNNAQFPSFNIIGWCGTPNASLTAGPIFPSTVVSNFPAPPVVTSNTFTAGGLIQVYWYHPIAHSDPNLGTAAAPVFKYGIRVALNYSATDMVVLNVHTGTPQQSTNGIVNGHIEQGTGYDPQAVIQARFVPNATFVLPVDKTCDACVLQFWLDSSSDNGGYVDCADIKIQAAGPTNPATATPTTSTPTNSNTPTTSTPTKSIPTVPTIEPNATPSPTPTPSNMSSSSTGGVPRGSASTVSSHAALIVVSVVMSLLWL